MLSPSTCLQRLAGVMLAFWLELYDFLTTEWQVVVRPFPYIAPCGAPCSTTTPCLRCPFRCPLETPRQP